MDFASADIFQTAAAYRLSCPYDEVSSAAYYNECAGRTAGEGSISTFTSLREPAELLLPSASAIASGVPHEFRPAATCRFAVAVAALFVAHLLRTVRWGMLETRHPRQQSPAAGLGSTGYIVNAVLPFRIGEIVRGCSSPMGPRPI